MAAAFVDRHLSTVLGSVGLPTIGRCVDEAIARCMPDPDPRDDATPAGPDARRFVVDKRQVSFDGTLECHGVLDLADALAVEDAVAAEVDRLRALGATEAAGPLAAIALANLVTRLDATLETDPTDPTDPADPTDPTTAAGAGPAQPARRASRRRRDRTVLLHLHLSAAAVTGAACCTCDAAGRGARRSAGGGDPRPGHRGAGPGLVRRRGDHPPPRAARPRPGRAGARGAVRGPRPHHDPGPADRHHVRVPVLHPRRPQEPRRQGQQQEGAPTGTTSSPATTTSRPERAELRAAGVPEAELPEQPGPTDTLNIAPLCRNHHRLKTLAPARHRWELIQHDHGTWTWRAPGDHTHYLRDHTGTHVIPTWPPREPPDDRRPAARPRPAGPAGRAGPAGPDDALLTADLTAHRPTPSRGVRRHARARRGLAQDPPTRQASRDTNGRTARITSSRKICSAST